jgi:Lar family restriction alleviation protein
MELKPCPFCGGNSDGIVILERYGYFIVCEHCYGRTGEFHTKEEAIEAWNRRAENG